MKHTLIFAAALLLAGFGSGAAQPAPSRVSCAPSMGLNYICGMKRPEDLLQIGTSKYLVFGGSAPGGGVGLIDTQAKTYRQFDITKARPDLKLYPDCPSVPDPKVLRTSSTAAALLLTMAASSAPVSSRMRPRT